MHEGISSAKDERTRILKHALPQIGSVGLVDFRATHFEQLAKTLKSRVGPDRSQLAPKTVHHVMNTVKAMFASAVKESLLPKNPCVLDSPTRQLPPKTNDKDPLWRDSAIYTVSEVETLISSSEVKLIDRVSFALGLLGGLRAGEVAALQWKYWNDALQPLGKLKIAFTFDTKEHRVKNVKNEKHRDVPVHPALAEALRAWKTTGWSVEFGREPEPDDLIVPDIYLKHRTNKQVKSRSVCSLTAAWISPVGQAAFACSAFS